MSGDKQRPAKARRQAQTSRSEHKWGPTQHNQAQINKWGQTGTSKRTETSMNEWWQVQTRASEHKRGPTRANQDTEIHAQTPCAIALAPTKHHRRHAPHPATVALRDYNHQPNAWFAKRARVEEDGEEEEVMQEVGPP